MPKRNRAALALASAGVLAGILVAAPEGGSTLVTPATIDQLTRELSAKYGESERPRIERGVKQAAEFWRKGDGDEAAFSEMVRAQVCADSNAHNALFSRMEFALESLNGHMNEISRDFRRQSDLDLGEIYPFDEILAGYDPSAHVVDDFFTNRLAFAVLLNFPLTTLQQRLTDGAQWSRRQWAEARLAESFGKRVPADVNLAIAEAQSDAARYIARYNIWTHHLVDAKGERLFPEGQRLLSHWNLRDQIKADYAEGKAGLARQKELAQVCDRIVTQTIPAVVVDNPHIDWDPFTNAVAITKVRDSDRAASPDLKATNAPEPDTRYAMLLETFQAARKADPYSPTAPTLIARRFDENRQIPEAQVREMLEAVLTSPLVPRVAALIESRLGRPLEPFDVWYNGFQQRGKHTEAELDAIVKKKYPTAEAYEKDIPNLLMGLGFSKEKADYLAAHIVVDPARGSGHALGAQRRADKAHLRTRVEKGGMNYKGFNIAVHEMGHNVEQTFSLNEIDSTLLAGVPNTAFTEALAFVFQAHDLELLGLGKPDKNAEALKALNDFWMTYEIAGVALVDMGVWHWMYDHPDAKPAELKAATLSICRDLWNKYYAPVFKKKDVVATLGIYSHMIDSLLYLPDYPIGHLIAFQIEQQIEKTKNLGGEFERMAKIGNVAPDIWMKEATGSPVSPKALLTATERALMVVK
ncbi:MAG TPA: hypothetical protein VKG23_15055 [Thermoanaerobaculia bacterium]|nr:hypothetical protein [Thermoanaerobaculia bacterium]